MPRRLARLAPLAGLLACGDVEPGGCPSPLADTITVDALAAHLAALADIAADHDGTRASATPGYDASADYAARTLEAAGYTVTRQPFTYLDFELTADPHFIQLGPDPREYVLTQDYRVARFSASGDVQGPVVAVDLSLGPANQTTSGCEPADFAGFPAGAVALIQRGRCYLDDKLAAAAAAGAVGVVFFNQGDTPDRSPIFTPRLSRVGALPAVGVSYELGVALNDAIAGGLELRLVVDGRAVERTTENVLVETPATASGRVLMLGAHLDSVPAGPGINDNGSGVAAVLEIGRQLARCDLRHRVRLALWGAEELGLYGSEHYASTLPDLERAAIALYLNLDMIASPNSVRFLYDGDGSAFGDPGPDGSDRIEQALADAYAARGLPTRETPFDGRSDYGPFISRGIPAGGIFSGAEDLKTADEAEVFGGLEGLPYDSCYHAACDDLDNIDRDALLENSRAAAQVLESFAAASDPPFSVAIPRAHADANP